jgi:Phosphoserine phosphatase RsbU, N-terminal domain
VSTPLDRLTQNYTPALLTFLNHPNEEALHSAYELGRAALADKITLLDLIRTHHTVFGDILRTTTNPDDLPAIVNAAAADFLVEVLAPFEIARRGFRETTTPRTSPGAPHNPTSHT